MCLTTSFFVSGWKVDDEALQARHSPPRIFFSPLSMIAGDHSPDIHQTSQRERDKVRVLQDRVKKEPNLPAHPHIGSIFREEKNKK